MTNIKKSDEMVLEEVMERCIALSILCLFTAGCGHSDGLRVEWTEPFASNNASAASSEEAELLVEEGEPLVAGEDVYTFDVYHDTGRVLGALFFDPTDGRFLLRPMYCAWQGERCIGSLPYEARRSHYLIVETSEHRCPRVRLLRNGLEIDLARMRLRACAFALEADPD